jgi:hypothetical protein
MNTSAKANHAQTVTLAANRSEGDGLAGAGQGLASDPAHRSRVGCLPSSALSTPMTWSDAAGNLTPSPPFSPPTYSLGGLLFPHFDSEEALAALSSSVPPTHG